MKETAAPYRTVPLWVKAAIAFHVVAVTVWAIPLPPDAVAQEKARPSGTAWLQYWNNKYLKPLNPIRGYVLASGVWQYWDMFAPDPSATDWYGDAEVTYRDGTVRRVAYPRMVDLPIPEKYVKERYRKFFERAHDEGTASMWPPFAQRMARWAYKDPQNPPVVVRLFWHKLQIAPPGGKQGTEYQGFNYYSYAVDQAALRRDRGLP